MATSNLVVSLVIGGLFAVATTLTWIAALLTSWILGVGVVVRAAAFQLAARLAPIDRKRLGRLGFPIEAVELPRAAKGASFRDRQLAWGRAHWLWRLPVYQLARLPLAATCAFIAVAWWWSIIACFVLAGGPSGRVALLGWQIGPVSANPAAAFGLVIAGVVGMLGWPLAVRGLLGLDVALARELLEPNRRGELAATVERLSEARTLAIQSAEAERRRIERDLHDGLQPQLVSLALELGLARSRFDRDPDAARSMVERAHEQAKRAAEDLRNLVRGIHPSVLDERGLDAALSALLAACPVPVTTDIDVPADIDPGREAVAYYVVAEAITNVAKHAGARRASVVVESDGTTLHVLVEDDGTGGAHLEPSGGLSGLAARVTSIDGTFDLTSPPGGPTRLEAMIPCAP